MSRREIRCQHACGALEVTRARHHSVSTKADGSGAIRNSKAQSQQTAERSDSSAGACSPCMTGALARVPERICFCSSTCAASPIKAATSEVEASRLLRMSSPCTSTAPRAREAALPYCASLENQAKTREGSHFALDFFRRARIRAKRRTLVTLPSSDSKSPRLPRLVVSGRRRLSLLPLDPRPPLKPCADMWW